MNKLNAILKQIDNFLPSESYIPSKEEKDVRKEIEMYGFENPEILSVFSWKNGNVFSFDKQDNLEFCGFGYLLSLNDAIDFFQNKTLPFKKHNFFPFVTDYSGQYLLLDLNSELKSIYIYSPSLFISSPIKIFSTLEVFLSLVLDCYENNAYVISNNELMIDYDKEEEIFTKGDNVYRAWSENN